MNSSPFSGSYPSGEVEFLLCRLQLASTSLPERERLIQSGQRHYSEMIGPEDAPNRERLNLFRQSIEINGTRFAKDLARLADTLAASATDVGELTLVSIARAGTPVGVILWHRIRVIAPNLRLTHYSISVIRDRGVDFAALSYILDRHAPASIRFLDGWTGKGTIARELNESISGWAAKPSDLDPGLWVPLDVCGVSKVAASTSDYLIPSCLLGGTVSGLVSRSILPREQIRREAFHGCVYLTHLRRYDLSNWFVTEMNRRLSPIPAAQPLLPRDDSHRRAATSSCLITLLTRYNLTDPNRVKLGIGETVRVLLRRQPKVIVVRNPETDSNMSLVSKLAEIRGTAIEVDPNLPFESAAVIADATESFENHKA